MQLIGDKSQIKALEFGVYLIQEEIENCKIK